MHRMEAEEDRLNKDSPTWFENPKEGPAKIASVECLFDERYQNKHPEHIP
jgi:hypothetical protein